MILIKSDSDLRKFLPNVLATVSGEASLFDKLSSYLLVAEHWLQENITSESVLSALADAAEDNPLRVLASRSVVCHAFAQAVPALDLVLTPNGFGIVSNSNVAPASKERVERLLQSLNAERFTSLETLLPLLHTLEGWPDTAQCRFFSATLFPSLDVTRLVPVTSQDPWANYLLLRLQLIAIEHELADMFVSTAVYERLRTHRINGSETAEELALTSQLRSVELAMLRGEPLNHHLMRSIVNNLRNDATNFPEWAESPTAKLYQLQSFQNTKGSTGYWF